MVEPIEKGPEDEEVKRLMEDHDIDEGAAEKAQELIDEGLDEDEAIEIAPDL
ncbi:MAG: hypothetical protein Q8P21_01745 [bacterium]|nr:hypothetical protein [bacterium]